MVATEALSDVARSPGASRTTFFDSNSTTNAPITVKPPAGDRSSTVIFVCEGALGGRRSWSVEVALRTPHFRDFAPLGFCISRRQRRLPGHIIGVVHFWTQKGTHGRQNRGIIIRTIGTQNGMQSDSRDGANTAFFVTGPAEQMLWERRGCF